MKEMQVNFLEMHYLFNDDSHTIDAFVRNKCEKELLAIIHQTLKELGLTDKVQIEAKPSKKGSFVDELQFSSNAMAIGGLLLTSIGIITTIVVSRPKETKLDKELKQLQIDKTKLEIKKLQRELEQEHNKNFDDDHTRLYDFIELIYEMLIQNTIILRHISNFYQSLINYEKVHSIEYTPYDQNHTPIIEPQIVHREDFHKFILQTSEDEIIDENAKIYIHSPILVKGRKHWSGYYTLEEQVINFSMSDKDFKNEVTNGTIKFANGSFIYGRLRKTLKFDDSGNIKNQKYTVELVTKISNDNNYAQETVQGKAYRKYKEYLKKQLSLELNEE